MASSLLTPCGVDLEMKTVITSLAVTGWNIPLYSETEEEYLKKINVKIPESLSEKKRMVFCAFVLQIIKKKRADFDGMEKGITEIILAVRPCRHIQGMHNSSKELLLRLSFL